MPYGVVKRKVCCWTNVLININKLWIIELSGGKWGRILLDEGEPINYDYKHRPRRQDFKGTLVENGAFYINRIGGIIQDKNRLSKPIKIYEMPEYTYVEIDEESDWMLAEKIHKKYIFTQWNYRS